MECGPCKAEEEISYSDCTKVVTRIRFEKHSYFCEYCQLTLFNKMLF